MGFCFLLLTFTVLVAIFVRHGAFRRRVRVWRGGWRGLAAHVVEQL